MKIIPIIHWPAYLKASATFCAIVAGHWKCGTVRGIP